MSKATTKVRALAGLAYQRELGAALEALAADFARWRDGAIDAFELSDRVHAFHDGTARELYQSYVRADPAWAAASALERGVVSEADTDAEVLAALENHRAALEQLRESPDDERK